MIKEWVGWSNIPQREQKRVAGRLQAKYDGLDEDNDHFWELKTSKNHWTQQMADESDQITMYALVHYKNHDGIIPRATLISSNINNGKIKCFETNRSREQLLDLDQQLCDMIEYIDSREWWEKRKKFNK